MADIAFNLSAFRAQFTSFSDAAKYPDLSLTSWFDTGANYISADDYGDLTVAQRTLALNFMTAHLLALNDIILTGDTPGLVQNATIDKVSVTMTPPPLKNQWQHWLCLTPYGQQLLALLQSMSVGGFFVGGRPEVSAFRRAGGFR